jgi:hypothetical protein
MKTSDPVIIALIEKAQKNWDVEAEVSSKLNELSNTNKKMYDKTFVDISEGLDDYFNWKPHNPKRQIMEPYVHGMYERVFGSICKITNRLNEIENFLAVSVHDEVIGRIIHPDVVKLWKARPPKRQVAKSKVKDPEEIELDFYRSNRDKLNEKPDFIIGLENQNEDDDVLPCLTVELKPEYYDTDLEQIVGYLKDMSIFFDISSFYGLLGDKDKAQFLKYDRDGDTDKLFISKNYPWNPRSLNRSSRIMYQTITGLVAKSIDLWDEFLE